MNNKILQVIACPRCHAKLRYDKDNQRLICDHEQLAYPIENGIPVLLPESGIVLTEKDQQNGKI
ncbi:Trm112 family protein [Testudinibacter sp. P27/CKL/0425]